jgi:4-carboxymuconolactone decarboxylase
MKDDEAIVHDFIKEIHDKKEVSDATYKRVVDRFGERGVMDLIGLTGYYTMLAMVLNVTRVALPEGAAPPLSPLK